MAAVEASSIQSGRGTNLSNGIVDTRTPRFKTGFITAPNTTDDTDTITIDLFQEFGIEKLLTVDGWIHTTENSIIVAEAPTTTTTNETVTITVGGSTDNKKRFYIVRGI